MTARHILELLASIKRESDLVRKTCAGLVTSRNLHGDLCLARASCERLLQDIFTFELHERDALRDRLKVRQCRVCKCTESTPCTHDEEQGPCWWVDEDLCSYCDKAVGPRLTRPDGGVTADLTKKLADHLRGLSPADGVAATPIEVTFCPPPVPNGGDIKVDCNFRQPSEQELRPGPESIAEPAVANKQVTRPRAVKKAEKEPPAPAAGSTSGMPAWHHEINSALAKGPLSSQEVFNKIRTLPGNKNLTIGTIYQALSKMRQDGKIQTVQTDEGNKNALGKAATV